MHTEPAPVGIPLPAINQPHGELDAGERARLFAHGEALRAVASRDELVDCLGNLRGWLNAGEIVVAAGPIDALSEMHAASSGDDPRWRDLYLREGFVRVDPIIRRILNGQRFVDRARVIAENEAAGRRLAKGPALSRLQEAARDYNRTGYGFASGTVFRGWLALCSVVAVPGQSSGQASRMLRALRPALYQATIRIMPPARAFPDLSQRELGVLECLASGHNDTRIADVMAISESTVRFHLGNIFAKLGAHNRCHAVSIGFQSGLLQL